MLKLLIKFIIVFFVNFLFLQQVLADQPSNWQLDFQTPASPIMQELYQFHNFLLWIIIGIVLFVVFLIIYVILRFNEKTNPVPAKFTHNNVIEIIWTVIPVIILVAIAIPSFRILRLAEHTPEADLTIKVTGAQWYWTYQYPDHENINFDSYMLQDKDLKPGQLRLLEVDNRIIIPQGQVVKFLITAADVIHSFAVPSLGIKTDAVPGRINETWTKIDRLGVYYGQCSEICGANHGFMPIAIEVVTPEDFEKWLMIAKTKFAQLPSMQQHSSLNLSKID